MKKIITSIGLSVLLAGMAISARAEDPKSDAAPTAQSAMDADEALAKAMRENNVEALQTYLSDGWAVVTGHGEVGEGNSVFPDGIRSGHLTRKTFELSEPRVRLYGNTALITTKVALSGVFAGKPFDVQERQTDVWVWTDGKWKCVLTHETMIPKDRK
jgi:ketosteroid isomerase-like protein